MARLARFNSEAASLLPPWFLTTACHQFQVVRGRIFELASAAVNFETLRAVECETSQTLYPDEKELTVRRSV